MLIAFGNEHLKRRQPGSQDPILFRQFIPGEQFLTSAHVENSWVHMDDYWTELMVRIFQVNIDSENSPFDVRWNIMGTHDEIHLEAGESFSEQVKFLLGSKQVERPPTWLSPCGGSASSRACCPTSESTKTNFPSKADQSRCRSKTHLRNKKSRGSSISRRLVGHQRKTRLEKEQNRNPPENED